MGSRVTQRVGSTGDRSWRGEEEKKNRKYRKKLSMFVMFSRFGHSAGGSR